MEALCGRPKCMRPFLTKPGIPHASQASASPLTDGEHIIAHFGSRGLYCLDMKGEVQWSKQFGAMRTRNGFGEGSSPSLYGDVLVMTWDHEGDSFIVALTRAPARSCGARIATRRPLGRRHSSSPSTATPGHHDGHQSITRLRPHEREVVWTCTGMTANCIPSPVYRDGVIYLMSGFRGNKLQAIKLAGAKGNITGSDHVMWSHGKGTSYTPSALMYDDHLYFVRSNNGVLSCLNRKTGEVLYEGSGSPTFARSTLPRRRRRPRLRHRSRRRYGCLKHGAEYEEVATNELDDGFDASAAIVGDEIYLRGQKSLYCIGK